MYARFLAFFACAYRLMTPHGNKVVRMPFDRFEGDFVSLGVGISLGSLEFAIDGYEDVLIEAGIGFHARFGLL